MIKLVCVCCEVAMRNKVKMTVYNLTINVLVYGFTCTLVQGGLQSPAS